MSGKSLERAKGIEPSYAAWEAAVLPLNYARRCVTAAVSGTFQGPAQTLDQGRQLGRVAIHAFP